MLSLQNHRRLTQLFAVESVALVPEREDDEIHSDFDGYGDDPAKTFTQAPQNGLILPGMVTQIDDENSVSVRSEEHTSELQSLMRISYAVFCLKKKNIIIRKHKKKIKSKDHVITIL